MVLPTRGQADWDDELNNEIQRLDSDVQSAKADTVSAKADAAYAKSKSDEALAYVQLNPGPQGPQGEPGPIGHTGPQGPAGGSDAATAEWVQSGPATTAALNAAYASKAAPSARVDDWPTPFYIAHRANPLLAPEGSLTAYRMAADAGADAIELDMRLLADGTLVTMHDATIDATTDGSGNVADLTAAKWAQLRITHSPTINGSGSWPSEPPPTVEQILRELGGKIGIMAQSYATGSVTALAAMCDRLGVSRDTILIMTNVDAEQAEALGLGFDVIRVTNSTAVPIEAWATAGVRFVGIQEDQTTQTFVDDCHALGLKVVPWSPNSHWRRDELLALGVDGIITDDTAYQSGAYTVRRRDAFAAQAVTAGHHLVTGSALGSWLAPSTRRFAGGALSFERLGYINPADPNDFTLEVDITPQGGTTEVAAHVWIGGQDHYHNSVAGTWDGYLFTLLRDGKVRFESMVDGTRATWLGYNVESGAMVDGTAYTFRFTVTATTIRWERVDSAVGATYSNAATRPLPYVGIAGYISPVDFNRVEYVA